MIKNLNIKIFFLTILLLISLQWFTYSACFGGVLNGMADPWEDCDNWIWNGKYVSFSLNPACNSDCTNKVGCFKAFNPYTNTIYEYANEGNCNGGVVACAATSSCPSFAATT